MNKKYNVIDLFSGCGGLSHGFANAGFKIIVANDFWDSANKTYAFNHPDTILVRGDITKNKIKEKIYNSVKNIHIDIIIGGPPCQSYSTVGMRNERDPRGLLFWNFIEIVNKINPSYFLFENVKGLLSMRYNNNKLIDVIINGFKHIGYNCRYKILNSVDYGVPQLRERVFILGGITKNKLLFPFPTHKEKHQKNLLDYIKKFRLNETVRTAISDLPILRSGEKLHDINYPILSESEYQSMMREDSKRIYDHIVPSHSKLVLERIRHITPKGNHSDLPKDLQLKGGFPNIYGRLCWDEPADTITGNCGCVSAPGRFIHPRDHRVISIREAARLQSFKDSYRFFGVTSSKYRQIGNAVPPLMAESIANSVKIILNN